MKFKKNCVLVIAILLVCLIVKGMTSVSAEATNDINYTQKSVFDDGEDGWVYVFEIVFSNLENRNYYYFDGYNLKYKELKGYYIPLINSETGEVLDKIIPDYITLSISEYYGNDIKEIANFFNEKQFVDKINLNDLVDLNISTIDKEYLIDLFNRTLESETKKDIGDYINASYVGKVTIESTNDNLVGEWQASYILDYGRIKKVNIEFISDNNVYTFSSKKNNNLKDMVIKNEIDSIEAQLTDTNMTIQKVKTNKYIDSTISNDLNLLIKKLYERLEEDLTN